MLSTEEKDRIHLEEQYRAEVRQRLAAADAPPPRRNPVWAFLNSAFGLWLLSAVLITGTGSLVTRWQSRRAEEARVAELEERLDLEIAHRISQVLVRLAAVADTADTNRLAPGRTPADVGRAVALLSAKGTDEIPPLYAEFANLGLPALIAELRRHQPEKGERQELDRMIASLVSGGIAPETEWNNPRLVAGRVIEKVVARRDAWGHTWFWYVDCPADSPFC